MTSDRFNEIKDALSPSIRMDLDYIRKFLRNGHASVMVGAGFSRNAIMDDGYEMKNWNAFAEIFYKKLYGEDAIPQDNMFLSPIRLASQIESIFGKHELDENIKEALPDTNSYPSELHTKLLSLNWADVFTTNYDTLLERAISDSGRYYYVVTDKQSLLYQSSPRIIKLHGSFPDKPPYIMSEEDYRKYPQCYPEFVNTVRQSLIENVMCMIGFSGEDPNFQSWIGWMRDVVGSISSPVYQIIHNNLLHKSEVELMKKRHVKIINLAENEKILDINEALDFFFDYLNESIKDDEWNPVVTYHDGISSEVINEMRYIRESYPGWFLLPTQYYDKFNDCIVETTYIGKDVKALDNITKLHFLYELIWRIQLSLSPYDIDWLEEELLVFVKITDQLTPQEEFKRQTLLIALLQLYRRQGKISDFKDLENEIREINIKEDHLRNLLNYEKCLFYLENLNYEMVNKILNQWKVNKFVYEGVIWKSVVLAEIGYRKESLKLICEALTHLNQVLLSCSGCQLLRLRSFWVLLKRLENVYVSSPSNLKDLRDKNYQFDFANIISSFQKRQLQNIQKPKHSETFQYQLESSVTTWHLDGPGFENEYVLAYRAVTLFERSGYPFGFYNLRIESDNMELFLSKLARYDVCFSARIAIRSCNEKLIDKCFKRENLHHPQIGTLFNTLFLVCNDYDKNNKELYARINRIVYPLLSRLCPKLDASNAIMLFPLIYDAYMKTSNIKEEYLSAIEDCLDDEECLTLIETIYTSEVIKEKTYLPKRGYNNYEVTSDAIQRIRKGLENPDADIRNASYLRTINIYKDAKFEEKQKESLDQAIIKWRNEFKTDANAIYSFNLIPPADNDEKEMLEQCIGCFVEELMKGEYVFSGNTEPISNFNTNLRKLNIHPNLLRNEDVESVLQVILSYLNENEAFFKKDDSAEFMGGLRYFTKESVANICKFIYHTNLFDVNKDLLKTFYKVVKRYKEYKFPVLSILIKIDVLLKTKDYKSLSSDIEKELINPKDNGDALLSLKILAENKLATVDIISNLLEYCTYSQVATLYIQLGRLNEIISTMGVVKTHYPKYTKLLSSLYSNLSQYNIPFEAKCNVCFEMLKLACKIAKLENIPKGLIEATRNWEKLANEDDTPLDVRRGWEQ